MVHFQWPVEHHHHHHYPPPLPVHKPDYWWGPTFTYGSTTAGNAGTTGNMMRCTDNSSGAENLVANNACFLNQTNSPAQDSALQATIKCMAVAAPQDNPDFNLGTGWGKEKEDRVTEKEFERDGELATISIYYSDSEGLKKVGIDTEEKPAITKVPLPQGFGGFCVPPKLTAGS